MQRDCHLGSIAPPMGVPWLAGKNGWDRSSLVAISRFEWIPFSSSHCCRPVSVCQTRRCVHVWTLIWSIQKDLRSQVEDPHLPNAKPWKGNKMHQTGTTGAPPIRTLTNGGWEEDSREDQWVVVIARYALPGGCSVEWRKLHAPRANSQFHLIPHPDATSHQNKKNRDVDIMTRSPISYSCVSRTSKRKRYIELIPPYPYRLSMWYDWSKSNANLERIWSVMKLLLLLQSTKVKVHVFVTNQSIGMKPWAYRYR